MTYALYIDFRKASDCINHSILISKLGKVGFHSETVNWFRSYLFNWSQRTLANGRIPNVLPVTHGVPQGSILGPLAFLIFINDLPNVLKCCQFKLSADDTVYALQATISVRFLITYKVTWTTLVIGADTTR